MIKTLYPNTELKKIIKDFYSDYNRTAESTKKEYLMTLPIGAKIPDESRIYDAEELERFKERASQKRAKALSIVDEHLTDVREKMTEAPSTDAVSTITLLNSRQNITENEINHLVEAYGDNYQSYKAIQDIGTKNNIRIPEHILTKQEESLNNLRHSVDSALTYETASRRSQGFYDFLAVEVDGTIVD